MTSVEAVTETFNHIKEEYEAVPCPKYRQKDLQWWTIKYESLVQMKSSLINEMNYINLLNAVTQIVNRLQNQELTRKHAQWSNPTERGINKALPVCFPEKMPLQQFISTEGLKKCPVSQ